MWGDLGINWKSASTLRFASANNASSELAKALFERYCTWRGGNYKMPAAFSLCGNWYLGSGIYPYFDNVYSGKKVALLSPEHAFIFNVWSVIQTMTTGARSWISPEWMRKLQRGEAGSEDPVTLTYPQVLGFAGLSAWENINASELTMSNVGNLTIRDLYFATYKALNYLCFITEKTGNNSYFIGMSKENATSWTDVLENGYESGSYYFSVINMTGPDAGKTLSVCARLTHQSNDIGFDLLLRGFAIPNALDGTFLPILPRNGEWNTVNFSKTPRTKFRSITDEYIKTRPHQIGKMGVSKWLWIYDGSDPENGGFSYCNKNVWEG